MGFQRAEQRICQHERTLSGRNARFAGEPAVHLRHHVGQLLMADQHRANRRLVIVQRVVQTSHVAAGNAEHHVDTGFFQHSDNRFR